jgi:SAM-dependent methyltransferase
MSHPQQIAFVNSVRQLFPTYFAGKKVLEVGSLDINGSVRQFFSGCTYTGIDVGPGKGVDIVCEGQKYQAPDQSFDVTISCECFEHNPYWAETFANMVRMTKHGGLVVFTCATTGRREHGTTRTSPQDSPLTVGLNWEYYKNLTEDDFRGVFDFDANFSRYGFSVHPAAADLYFYGVRS